MSVQGTHQAELGEASIATVSDVDLEFGDVLRGRTTRRFIKVKGLSAKQVNGRREVHVTLVNLKYVRGRGFVEEGDPFTYSLAELKNLYSKVE